MNTMDQEQFRQLIERLMSIEDRLVKLQIYILEKKTKNQKSIQQRADYEAVRKNAGGSDTRTWEA